MLAHRGETSARREGLAPSTSKVIRHVQAIPSLSQNVPDSRVTAQTLATMSASTKPIRMVQHYPVIDSQWSSELTLISPTPTPPSKSRRNRESVVLDGVLHLAGVPSTPLTPLNQAFQTFQSQCGPSTRNVLKKRTQPSNPQQNKSTLRRLTNKVLRRKRNNPSPAKARVISGPSSLVHLDGRFNSELVSLPHSPSSRSSQHLHQSLERERGKRAEELKASASRGAFAAPEDALKSHPARRPDVPRIIIRPPTPGSSSPRSPNPNDVSSRSSSSGSSRLAADSSWRQSFELEHKRNYLLRRKLEDAIQDIRTLKNNVDILNERAAQREEEIRAAQIEAARDKKTSEHLRRMYDLQSAKLQALEPQFASLQKPGPQLENILELPAATTHRIPRKPCPAPDPVELPAKASHWVLQTIHKPAPPREIHELSATSSTGILRTSSRENTASQSEAEKRKSLPHKLPSLESLGECFSDLFPDQKFREEEEEKSGILKPHSLTIPPHITLANIRYSTPLSDAEEPIPRPRKSPDSSSSSESTLFRFGGRRLATPAHNRIPLESSEDAKNSVVPRLNAWSWSSVPDLELGQPGRW